MKIHPIIQEHYQSTHLKLLNLLPPHFKPTTFYNSRNTFHQDVLTTIIDHFKQTHNLPNLAEELKGLFSPTYYLHDDFIAIYGVVSRTCEFLVCQAANAES